LHGLTLFVRHSADHPARNINDDVRAWLSVWSKVQMIRVHGPADATASPTLKPRMVLPFWCQLTWVVLIQEKWSLDECCDYCCMLKVEVKEEMPF